MNPYRCITTGMEMTNGNDRGREFREHWLRVPAAEVRTRYPFNVDARIDEVVFRSSAWTGRK